MIFSATTYINSVKFYSWQVAARENICVCVGGGAVAQAYNGGLETVPPVGSRGKAPGQGVHRS